jgi:hypothetical protein
VLAGEAGWADEIVTERESFASAARSLIESGDEEAATELATNVWRLWVVARDPHDGRTFLAAVLDGRDGEPSRTRALALYDDGLLALMVGAHEDSRARSEASLEAARTVGDPEALALAHLGLSRVAFLDGDYEGARLLAAVARDFARALDPALGQAPLHMHAQGTRFSGDYEQAAALFEESLALNRRIGDQALGTTDDPYAVAAAHLNRVAVAFAFARSDGDRATALLADTDSMLEESRTDLAPDDRFELDGFVAI